MRTFDDTAKYSSNKIPKKGQLSVRNLNKQPKREPVGELSPDLTKLETKVSNGATLGDLIEESEPLNLNVELFPNTQ